MSDPRDDHRSLEHRGECAKRSGAVRLSSQKNPVNRAPGPGANMPRATTKTNSLGPEAAYSVQFVMPVDNPENNVRRRDKGRVIHFEVPINHPNAHTFGWAQFAAAAAHGERLRLSPPLNNTVDSEVSKDINKA